MTGDADLLDLLDARSGLVCFVGAGGKKTTLYRLGAAHPGRVGITATVHIPFFPRSLAAHRVVASEDEIRTAVLAAADRHQKIAFARPSEKHGRYAGLATSLVARIHAEAGFDLTLVKADGARNRWIKAPGEGEPQIPPGARIVIPVVSARAIGERLCDRIAHRPALIERLGGGRADDPLTPLDLARLLAAEDGALRGIGEARAVPLINMVDDEEREALAREVAEHALRLSERFDRVVLASMRRDPAVVAVVRR